MRKGSLSVSDWRMELNIDDVEREDRNMKDSPKTFVAMNLIGFLTSLSIWCIVPFFLLRRQCLWTMFSIFQQHSRLLPVSLFVSLRDLLMSKYYLLINIVVASISASVCSPTVRIIAFQAIDPGSTPGRRIFFL